MQEPKKGYTEALYAAREFGAEARANEQEKLMLNDDRANIAFYYGVENWSPIEEAHREQLVKAFYYGWTIENYYH